MKTDDLARKALTESEMEKMKWMLMARVKRGETLQLEKANIQLMARLSRRSRELESQEELAPETVTDWLALALYAENRHRFILCCKQAEDRNDIHYRKAEYWLQYIKRNENEEEEKVKDGE